eukprot:3471290-Prymnesium_polylepis.1
MLRNSIDRRHPRGRRTLRTSIGRRSRRVRILLAQRSHPGKQRGRVPLAAGAAGDRRGTSGNVYPCAGAYIAG